MSFVITRDTSPLTYHRVLRGHKKAKYTHSITLSEKELKAQQIEAAS